jgi:thiol-disulfide isomerase/thioredoxin
MRRFAAAVALLVLLAGCSTSKDAVEQGQDFQFVAPGGQTTIMYDPPSSRGAISGITGPSLLKQGTTVGIENFPGKAVVINIWGSWCGPCREEAPTLELVSQQPGVAVLGIDVRDDRSAAADFVTDRGLTYDSIYDNAGRVLGQLHGYPRNTVPSTIVLDKQHRVAAVFLTKIQMGDIAPLLQKLNAEQAG